MNCHFCHGNLDKLELYVGEKWNPPHAIDESFWLGEEEAICTECAMLRTKETFGIFRDYAELFGVNWP